MKRGERTSLLYELCMKSGKNKKKKQIIVSKRITENAEPRVENDDDDDDVLNFFVGFLVALALFSSSN